MKRVWLITFNVITLLAWAVFLAHALNNGLGFSREGLMLLSVAQGLAIFEILNSIIGIAGANWLLTTMQVFSRLLVVGLLNWIPEERWLELDIYDTITGFALITIAWGVTEIVRALYYLSDLLNKEIKAITWSRYTFFIILYPMGVLGEFLIMFTFWEYRQFEFNVINIGLAVIALSYFIFFPKLYLHMFRQRKKKV